MFVLFCSFLFHRHLIYPAETRRFTVSVIEKERRERGRFEKKRKSVNALFPNFNSTSRDSLKHCSPIINVSILEQYLGL